MEKKHGGARKNSGRKVREITTEMIADLTLLSREEYIEKHKVGEMYFLNLYHKNVSMKQHEKKQEPAQIDIFDGVLVDTYIMYTKGHGAWFRHIQEQNQKADWACSDILHKVEAHEMTDAEKIELIDMLKYWRNQRRLYANSALFYNENRAKVGALCDLMNTIHEKRKKLAEMSYHTRVLAKEIGEVIKANA